MKLFGHLSELEQLVGPRYTHISWNVAQLFQTVCDYRQSDVKCKFEVICKGEKERKNLKLGFIPSGLQKRKHWCDVKKRHHCKSPNQREVLQFFFSSWEQTRGSARSHLEGSRVFFAQDLLETLWFSFLFLPPLSVDARRTRWASLCVVSRPSSSPPGPLLFSCSGGAHFIHSFGLAWNTFSIKASVLERFHWHAEAARLISSHLGPVTLLWLVKMSLSAA